MTRPSQFDPEKPPEEHFAAYADGELRGEDLLRLEEWLSAHPEDAARVEAQQQPSALCRRSPPPEPTEANWAAAFETIENALASHSAAGALSPSRQRAPTRLAVGIWAAAAAAIVALVFYLEKSQPIGGDQSAVKVGESPASNSDDAEEDLAFLQDPDIAMLILSPDDVDIVSLEGSDDSALVVGAPPVGPSLALVSPGDVVLQSLTADEDGTVAEMRLPQGPAGVPMIVTPLLGSNSDRKKP